MKYNEARAHLRDFAEKWESHDLDDVAASIVLERLAALEHVADAARSLRDSKRVGLISLVIRDEGSLNRALDALDGPS